MSADNWDTCPTCLAKAEADRVDLKAKAEEAYGHVPIEEFEALRAAANETVLSTQDYVTFREDYEIWGASDGVIRVSYSGHCDVCGTGIDFKTEHPFGPTVGPV